MAGLGGSSGGPFYIAGWGGGGGGKGTRKLNFKSMLPKADFFFFTILLTGISVALLYES